jgi:hypothetical protein
MTAFYPRRGLSPELGSFLFFSDLYVMIDFMETTERAVLLRELDSLPSQYWDEVLDFVGYLKQKRLRNMPETMLLSEAALAKDWDTPEEDEAWAVL